MTELTKIQMMCQTKKTRDGVRNMRNRKPFRNAKLKAEARAKSYITVGGNYQTDVGVLYHT